MHFDMLCMLLGWSIASKVGAEVAGHCSNEGQSRLSYLWYKMRKTDLLKAAKYFNMSWTFNKCVQYCFLHHQKRF